MSGTTNAGAKADTGKLRYDLIPPEALRGLAHVYTLGAQKYADRNWEKGILYGRIYAALMRHLEQWRLGEDNDPDNAQRHLDSVVWNAVALATYEARGLGPVLDDLRPGRRKETGSDGTCGNADPKAES
jgi:hypothetical protein